MNYNRRHYIAVIAIVSAALAHCTMTNGAAAGCTSCSRCGRPAQKRANFNSVYLRKNLIEIVSGHRRSASCCCGDAKQTCRRCLGEQFSWSPARLIYLCATSTQIPSCFTAAQSAPLALFCVHTHKGRDFPAANSRRGKSAFPIRTFLGLIYGAVLVAWPKQVMADHFLSHNTLSVPRSEILVKFRYRGVGWSRLWLMPLLFHTCSDIAPNIFPHKQISDAMAAPFFSVALLFDFRIVGRPSSLARRRNIGFRFYRKTLIFCAVIRNVKHSIFIKREMFGASQSTLFPLFLFVPWFFFALFIIHKREFILNLLLRDLLNRASDLYRVRFRNCFYFVCKAD